MGKLGIFLFIGICASPAWAIDDLIIGGEPVLSGDPVGESTVAIDVGFGTCTGSLIAHDLVLTAAHCVNNGAMKIIFSSKTRDPNAITARVIGQAIHPEYYESTDVRDRNDIAVLRFEGHPPLGFAPARLLPEGTNLEIGQAVVLAGYGVTDGSTSTGSGTLRRVTTTVRDPHYSRTEIQVEQSEGRGACRGDSGGPAFIEENGVYYLFGVTNWGPGACDEYGVFANINAHRTWLEDSIERLRQAQRETALALAVGY